ncbi:MAG: hypothetical protein KGJ13_09940 [Patescibacteria group bacterium]|nr:hypothetical protein [Patescibacteria group bacterium]
MKWLLTGANISGNTSVNGIGRDTAKMPISAKILGDCISNGGNVATQFPFILCIKKSCRGRKSISGSLIAESRGSGNCYLFTLR